MSARGYLVFFCIVFFCLVLVSGCTQFQTLRPQDVSVGYTVQLVTKSDEHYKFRVTDISESEIIGDGIRIRFDDIKSIEQRDLTAGGEYADRLAGEAIVAVGLGLAIGCAIFCGAGPLFVY